MNPQALDKNWRAKTHQKVLDKPRYYLWVAFKISRLSSQAEVLKVFEKCARDTGCSSSEVSKTAVAFTQGDDSIPGYVLQCCSATLFARWY